MGKYSEYKSKYGAPPPQDPGWQEKVNAFRKGLECRGQPAPLAEGYSTLRLKKQKLEAEISGLNIEIEAHSQELVDWFESAGLTQFKMASGETIFIKDEPYSSVSDKVLFHQWIKDNSMEDLFSVHYQTMNSMVKDRLLNGDSEPPGVKVFIKTGINLRRG